MLEVQYGDISLIIQRSEVNLLKLGSWFSFEYKILNFDLQFGSWLI